MTETSRMTVDEWKRKRFDESSSCHNGALALFMEGSTVTLVRVSNIETDSWGVRVRITCEPTPGIGLLSQDRTEGGLSAAWSVFSSFGEMWSALYVGWKLFFDASLLAGIKGEAAEAAREGKALGCNQARDLLRRHREAKDRLESHQ